MNDDVDPAGEGTSKAQPCDGQSMGPPTPHGSTSRRSTRKRAGGQEGQAGAPTPKTRRTKTNTVLSVPVSKSTPSDSLTPPPTPPPETVAAAGEIAGNAITADNGQGTGGGVGVGERVKRPRSSLNKEEIMRNLQTGIYSLTPNPVAKNSETWDRFYLLEETATKRIIWIAKCKQCPSFYKVQEGGSGSTHLTRHQCSNVGVGVGVGVSTPQYRIAPPTVAKQAFLKLLVNYFGEEMLPVEKVGNESFVELCQGLLDLGSAYPGRLDATKLMPHPTTLSKHIIDEAETVMQVLGPTVAKAAREGHCSATTDMWTSDCNKDHYIAITASFVNEKGYLENHDLFASEFESKSATGENIRNDLLNKFESLGISQDDCKKIEFVTDGGSNMKSALKEYKWHYCLDHALNLVEKGTFTICYSDLVSRALEAAPEAREILECCNDAVKEVKPAIQRKNKALGKALHTSNWVTQSHVKMLQSVLLYRTQIAEKLDERDQQLAVALAQISDSDIQELVVFLTPFDLGGDRGDKPSVSVDAWPTLLDHCEPDDSESLTVQLMKDRVRPELVRMEAVALIEKCKELVAFFKKSPGLMSRLPKTLKQEVSTRWNSHLTMLSSVKGQLVEIRDVLKEHAVATKNRRNASRADGIDELLLNALVDFLEPFERESRRLEGDSYPTLPMAATSIRELLDHCEPKPDDCEVIAALRREASVLLRDTAKLDLTQMTAAFFWPNTRKLRVLEPADREKVLENVRSQLKSEDDKDAAAAAAASLSLEDVGDGSEDDPSDLVATADTRAHTHPSPSRFGSKYMDVLDEDGVGSIDELQIYVEEKIAYVKDPLQWWRDYGRKKYPKLWRVARRHLGITSSSAPSERVFSKTGWIMNPRRSNIKSSLVNAYVVLRSHRRNARRQKCQ